MQRPFVEEERSFEVQSVQAENLDCKWQSCCCRCTCGPLPNVVLRFDVFCSRTQFLGLDPAFAGYGEEGADGDEGGEGEGLVG